MDGYNFYAKKKKRSIRNFVAFARCQKVYEILTQNTRNNESDLMSQGDKKIWSGLLCTSVRAWGFVS